MRPSAVVFDMDGVLLLSNDAHREAFEQVLARYGIRDFHYEDYAGMRTDAVFEDVFRRHGVQLSREQLEACVREKRERASRRLAEDPPVAPGAAELLSSLSGTRPLVLATSSSRANVSLFLKASGTEACFREVVTGEDVQRAKPDPEIYRKAISATMARAEDVLVVEDAISGIAAALAAGAQVVAVEGTHTAEELRSAGAHEVVSNLVELLQRLQGR